MRITRTYSCIAFVKCIQSSEDLSCTSPVWWKYIFHWFWLNISPGIPDKGHRNVLKCLEICLEIKSWTLQNKYMGTCQQARNQMFIYFSSRHWLIHWTALFSSIKNNVLLSINTKISHKTKRYNIHWKYKFSNKKTLPGFVSLWISSYVNSLGD